MLCAVAFAALLATGAFASTSLGSRALPSSNITCSPVSNATAVEMVVFDSTNSTASTRLGVTPVQLADPTRAILQAYNDDNQTFTFYSCNTSSLGYISPSLSGEYTVYHGHLQADNKTVNGSAACLGVDGLGQNGSYTVQACSNTDDESQMSQVWSLVTGGDGLNNTLRFLGMANMTGRVPGYYATNFGGYLDGNEVVTETFVNALNYTSNFTLAIQ